jgi:hypothetical protein
MQAQLLVWAVKLWVLVAMQCEAERWLVLSEMGIRVVDHNWKVGKPTLKW